MDVNDTMQMARKYFATLQQVAGWVKARYFPRVEHIRESQGAVSAGRPIVTDATGKIDRTFIDDADVADVLADATAAAIVDADTMPFTDASDSNALKKITWSNIKATLKTYLDTLYVALTGDQNIAGVKTFTAAETINSGSSTSGQIITADNSNTLGYGQLRAFNNDDYRITIVAWGATFAGNTLGETRAGKGMLAWSGTQALVIGTDSTARIRIVTNSVRRISIENDGKVGIGIEPPISILHIYEDTSNTGTTAGVTIEQDGTGDAIVQLLLTGGQRWVIGIDNSDSDIFKISRSATLGTNDVLKLSTDDDVYSDKGDWASSFTITSATGSFTTLTYTTKVARYHKVGKMVDFQFYVVFNTVTIGTASGALRFALPFTVANNSNENYLGPVVGTGLAATYEVITCPPNVAYGNITDHTGSVLQASGIGAGDSIRATVRFLAA